jgi:hypothetical protein
LKYEEILYEKFGINVSFAVACPQIWRGNHQFVVRSAVISVASALLDLQHGHDPAPDHG